MKAIVLLMTLVSLSSFAGSFDTESRMLTKFQYMERVKANPEFYESLERYSNALRHVKDVEKRLAKEERAKALICHQPDYYSDTGVLAASDSRYEYMKICKASNKFTEESYKADMKIALLREELEISRVHAAYHYAKTKNLEKK